MTCTKRSFANRHAAEQQLLATLNDRSDRRQELRPYFHEECKAWHLTSQPRSRRKPRKKR
jgi:hypothetical protein